MDCSLNTLALITSNCCSQAVADDGGLIDYIKFVGRYMLVQQQQQVQHQHQQPGPVEPAPTPAALDPPAHSGWQAEVRRGLLLPSPMDRPCCGCRLTPHCCGGGPIDVRELGPVGHPVPLSFAAETLPLPCVFPLPRHCLCLVFPLPSWARHCICLVLPTALVAKPLPLPCVFRCLRGARPCLYPACPHGRHGV